MNDRSPRSAKAWLALPLLVAFCAPVDIRAAATDSGNPLRFYRGDNGSYLQATFQAEFAAFTQGNSWFGNSEGVLGERSDFWWESLLRPGIEGSFTLNRSQQIYGRLDATQANSGAGIDPDGTNLGMGAVNDLRIEKAYAGWRSGTLFPALGNDFVDISFGRQQYIAGNGFLFYGQGGSGFNRAAWYIGGRRSAQYAGIVRMKTGNWSGDLFYLEADDINKTNTRAGGATTDYAFETLATIGGGIYATQSDLPDLDDMHIFDLRGSVKPWGRSAALPALQPLKFEAEYAHEDNAGDLAAGRGWYIATSYQWDKISWQPVLTYRYASFNADFSPLFYGFTDWGSWFQGEIIGEYVLANRNLNADMIKLKFQPLDPVTMHLIYYRFSLDDAAAAGLASDDYADEVDLIIEWEVNSHLTLSMVGAYAKTGEAAVEQTGGAADWSYLMLYSCIKF